ncbi:MAG: hypothetical protein CM15mP49_22570 [Actinomycetota bacterium]|nr:MAG: hypothetical protein CM15mP49_22570 [Actinomycetota bacterium]
MGNRQNVPQGKNLMRGSKEEGNQLAILGGMMRRGRFLTDCRGKPEVVTKEIDGENDSQISQLIS